MKDASTAERTDFILYDVIQGPRQHPVATVEYLSDAGVWTEFDDILSISLNKNAQDNRYGSFSLLPETSEISLSFDNASEKYSPGRGGDFDGILIRNRKVRVNLGYNLQESVSKSLTLNVSDYQNQLYHTKIESGQVLDDITSAAFAPSLTGFTFNTYGSGAYGSDTYEVRGYYLMDAVDLHANRVEVLTYLEVYSGSANQRVYYRTGNTPTDLAAQPFVDLGATAVGWKTFNFTDTRDRYIQVAVAFVSGNWSDSANYISSVVIHYTDTAEYFSQGEFLLDDPSFSSSFGSIQASVSGRDYFKRAFETKVSMPAISAVDMGSVIRQVCDRALIPYTTTTIPLIGTSVSVDAANNFKDVSARDILDQCIAFLAGYVNGGYRLIINDDGYLELIIKPDTATSADYVMDYRTNVFSMSKGYTQNNLLQRMTVMEKDHTVDEEVLLDSDAYNTIGSKSLSWSPYPSIYKRVYITWGSSSADATFAITSLDNEGITFTLSGTTIDATVYIYGCKLQSSPPSTGEWIVDVNHVSTTKALETAGYNRRDGFTHKLTNVFCDTSAKAATIAEYFGSEYGNRRFELSVSGPGNPLLEINDKVMVFERYTNSSSIFILTGISHEFTAEGASFKSSYKFTDFGFTLPSLIWDLAGIVEGAADLDWDVGYLWDQDQGSTATEDTTDYSNTKEVQFS